MCSRRRSAALLGQLARFMWTRAQIPAYFAPKLLVETEKGRENRRLNGKEQMVPSPKDPQDLRTTEARTRRFYQVVPRRLRRLAKRTYLDLRHRGDRDRALPDFYIIGTMKSGTTALFMHLEDHPDIRAASKKEIQFYSTNRDLGTRYYRSHFPRPEELAPRDNVHGRQITGEATPDYLFHPAAAAHCARLTPDARLIVLMRDPVERAFSHWKQGHRFDFETESFETALALEDARLAGEADKLARDPHYYSYRHQLYSYKHRGYYADQLRPWLAHFPREQILLLKAEDMFEEGLAVYRQVTDFLGISPWQPEEFSLKFKGMDGEMAPTTRADLAAHFASHNQRLYELAGRDYGWQ